MPANTETLAEVLEGHMGETLPEAKRGYNYKQVRSGPGAAAHDGVRGCCSTMRAHNAVYKWRGGKLCRPN